MYSTTFVFLMTISGADVESTFQVEVRSGGPVRGEITAVAADGKLTLADEKMLPAGDWYSLHRVAVVLPTWPQEPHVELNNGDRIRGSVLSADSDAVRLSVSWPGLPDQVLRFPLSSVRVLWLRNRPDDVEPVWLSEPRRRDVIVTRNADFTLGSMSAIDVSRSQVRFQVDGKDRELQLSKVAAIALNTDLARVRRPKGPYYRLTLADGSRVTATSLTYDRRTWVAETSFKETMKIPPDRVLAIHVEQGTATYLSDLKPAKYQYHSFDGEEYSWVKDRSVGGQAMRLTTLNGVSTFDRGVGLHAECTIAYTLDRKYSRFESIAGLDARSGLRGDAILSVALDGKEQELANKGRLTPSGEPIAIKMDVTGVKEVTISVRRANGGNVQDHVNLADARLVP